MVDRKSLARSIIAIAFPVVILFFNTINLIGFLSSGGKFYIHQVFVSEGIYLSYLGLFSGLLILMIITAYKNNWEIYWILFVINAGFFLCPIIARLI